MYEKLAQPAGQLGIGGDRSTQNNSSLYKQGLNFMGREKGSGNSNTTIWNVSFINFCTCFM